MKAFVIAVLAAGTALFLAALLWPDRSPAATERKLRSLPVATTIGASDMRPVEKQPNSPTTLSHSAIAVEAAGATPHSDSAQESPYSVPKLNNPAIEPTATTSRVEARSPKPDDPQLTPEEQQTLKQTATSSTSLRNADFPRTYISSIHVDLTSPNHSVRLTWSGPQARVQITGPFHSSPGRGLGYNNCNDPAESCRADSNCTPKGTMHVQAFSETMTTSPECRFVTWFQTERGVAFHYYPFVPNYPASHGCVRLEDMQAAQLIHNNSKIGATEVVVDGNWKFVR